MKKWLVGYIILSLILLGIITFIGADKSSINTKYSNVYKESETIVQSAQNYYGSYLLISTNNDEKVVKVDKDRENYQILEMVVNDENLFFMYEYTPHLNEPIYGLGCYNLKSEKLHSYSISNLDAYTWLAFGVRDDKMYCLMNDIDNKEVVEFIVNDVSDADWEISQTFKYPDGHYVIKAGYVGGNVSIYLDDGSAYYYKDMKLCEYDNIAGTSFDEYVECGRELGLEVKRCDGFSESEVMVSSSKVRRALELWDIPLANKLLGYKYFVRGRVVEGQKINFAYVFCY